MMRERSCRFHFGPLALGLLLGGLAHRHFAKRAHHAKYNRVRDYFAQKWQRHHPGWCDEPFQHSQECEPEGNSEDLT